MSLNWKGDAIKKRMIAASIVGVNGTMAQTVTYAKLNHPWQNRSFTLEPGTRMIQEATQKGTVVSGLWGVANVLYGKYLEASRKWQWLRPAANVMYPRLAANIKEAFRRG